MTQHTEPGDKAHLVSDRTLIKTAVGLILVAVLILASVYWIREHDKEQERIDRRNSICEANRDQARAIEEFLVELFIDLGATPEEIEEGRIRYHEKVDVAHAECVAISPSAAPAS